MSFVGSADDYSFEDESYGLSMNMDGARPSKHATPQTMQYFHMHSINTPLLRYYYLVENPQMRRASHLAIPLNYDNFSPTEGIAPVLSTEES